MNTRCLLMLASGLLIAVPAIATSVSKPRAQSVNTSQASGGVTAEIIRRSRGNPQSSFTVVDANLTAVQVTFTLDSQDNVIAISVDRDATFDVATDEAPISLSRGEQARKGDSYWEPLYAKVIAEVRHSMLLGLT